eukprot:scaffold9214_cov138-Isochrysis_galbana.AAC.2
MRPAGAGGRRPGCRVRTPMCDRVWLYGHVAMISMHMRYVAHSAMARFSHRLLRASRQPSTFYVTNILRPVEQWRGGGVNMLTWRTVLTLCPKGTNTFKHVSS